MYTVISGHYNTACASMLLCVCLYVFVHAFTVLAPTVTISKALVHYTPAILGRRTQNLAILPIILVTLFTKMTFFVSRQNCGCFFNC